MNAVLDYSVEHGISRVYCPTGRQIVAHTKKEIRPELFRKIYDFPASKYHAAWLRLKMGNTGRYRRQRTSIASFGWRPLRRRPAWRMAGVCIFHDIEENIGTPVAPEECAESLTYMLAVEKDLEVAATYNVLGALLERKRSEIWQSSSRHSIAFHSFDHDLGDHLQLSRCRKVDLRVRGYRPPQSRITDELSDYNPARLNFEWFASSAGSLGHSKRVLRNGIVRIPIHVDDYALSTGQMSYEDWERGVLEIAHSKRFLAVGLHDYYGRYWLKNYAALLEKLGKLGKFVTADVMCDHIFLRESYARPGD
jgi:hypothetical protein